MLLISSITHSALAFLHSYLTVRGDDEPPLLIQSRVSMMCGLLWFLYDIIFNILNFFPCTFSSVSVFSVVSNTHKHTHRPQRSRVSWSSRQALLPNLDKWPRAAACVDLFSHNACLWMGFMGQWLPGVTGLWPEGDLNGNNERGDSLASLDVRCLLHLVFSYISQSAFQQLQRTHVDRFHSVSNVNFRNQDEKCDKMSRVFLSDKKLFNRLTRNTSCLLAVTGKLDILFHNIYLPLSLFVRQYKAERSPCSSVTDTKTWLSLLTFYDQ